MEYTNCFWEVNSSFHKGIEKILICHFCSEPTMYSRMNKFEYPMFCPHCGSKMLVEKFDTVNSAYSCIMRYAYGDRITNSSIKSIELSEASKILMDFINDNSEEFIEV